MIAVYVLAVVGGVVLAAWFALLAGALLMSLRKPPPPVPTSREDQLLDRELSRLICETLWNMDTAAER